MLCIGFKEVKWHVYSHTLQRGIIMWAKDEFWRHNYITQLPLCHLLTSENVHSLFTDRDEVL